MATYVAATIGVNATFFASTSTAAATAPPIIDPNHPYYRQTSDNPAIPLVNQLFTEQNYNQ